MSARYCPPSTPRRTRGFSLFTLLLSLVAASFALAVLAEQINKYLRVSLGESIGTEMAGIDQSLAPFLAHFSPAIQAAIINKASAIDISPFGTPLPFRALETSDTLLPSIFLDIDAIRAIHAMYKLPGQSAPYHLDNYQVKLRLSSITAPGNCDDQALSQKQCFVEALLFRHFPLHHKGIVDTLAMQSALKKMGSGGGITLPDPPERKASFVRFGANDRVTQRIENPIAGAPSGILVISSHRAAQHQPYFLRTGDTMQAHLDMTGHKIINAGSVSLGGTTFNEAGIRTDKSFSLTANKVLIGKPNKQVEINGDKITADTTKATAYDSVKKIVLRTGPLGVCDRPRENTLRVNDDGQLHLCTAGEWQQVQGKNGKSAKDAHKGEDGESGPQGLPGRGLRPTIVYDYQSYADQHHIAFGHGEVELNLTADYRGPGVPIQCSILQHSLNWRVQLIDEGTSWKATTWRNLLGDTTVDTVCNYMTITVNGKDVTKDILQDAIFR